MTCSTGRRLLKQCWVVRIHLGDVSQNAHQPSENKEVLWGFGGVGGIEDCYPFLTESFEDRK